MRGWLSWLSTGLCLALVFALGSALIALARLSPALARRMAGSVLAVALLNLLLRIAASRLEHAYEHAARPARLGR